MTPDRTTVYLRGVSRELLREAKAEAAREGHTLAAFVSDALVRRLRGDGGEPGERPPGDDLAADLAWYRARRAQLVRKYGGEFVAIVGGRVIDHDTDFEALAQRVFSRHPERSVLMPRVEAEDRVVRLRSPRGSRR